MLIAFGLTFSFSLYDIPTCFSICSWQRRLKNLKTIVTVPADPFTCRCASNSTAKQPRFFWVHGVWAFVGEFASCATAPVVLGFRKTPHTRQTQILSIIAITSGSRKRACSATSLARQRNFAFAGGRQLADGHHDQKENVCSQNVQRP